MIAQYEKIGTGALVWKKNIVYVGSKEIAEIDGSGTNITLVDHLGSPRWTWNGSGAPTQQKFLPFGESLTDPVSTARFAKGFTNHEQTDPSGLIYMQARFYAPWIGRFLSPDPSSISVDRTNPQSWGRYNYTMNNPLRYIDSNGKWPTETHNQIIDRAFPGLSVQQRSVLEQVSSWMDSPVGQTRAFNHSHAMRAPGEDPIAARRGINQTIQNHEDAAKRLQGNAPQHVNQIRPGAINEFGRALHVVTDRPSPAHTDQNGNPREWAGVPTTPSEIRAVKEHVREEANITPQQMDATVNAARESFQRVFGEAALKEAVTEPPKPGEKLHEKEDIPARMNFNPAGREEKK